MYLEDKVKKVSISEAKAKLSALIKAALAGERVILTKHGRAVAEIRPFTAVESLPEKKTPAEKLSAMRRIVKESGGRRLKGVSAAESADFLYDDTGLPS